MIHKKCIGKVGREEIYSFRLENQQGMAVEVINLGGIITGIYVPDHSGNIKNVVLRYKKTEDYLKDPYYIGCVVGRYANRISGGFCLDDKEYRLAVNEIASGNHLHGGFSGFNKKIWQVHQYAEKKEGSMSVTFFYHSEHLEEGYPGNLKVFVSYLLNEENELVVNYKATTDMPTVINLANHTYFNLSGERDILNHQIKVNAACYTPADNSYISKGSISPVAGTDFNLNEGTYLRNIALRIPTINYCLDNSDDAFIAARLYSSVSKRCLDIYTTEPGLQLYFGNFLDNPFRAFSGMAIEPQHYPDSPNHPEFPSTVLRPGQRYRQTTIYKFHTAENV